MDRWNALVALLQDSPVTPRVVATNLIQVIEKGRWSKDERQKVDAIYDELVALVQKWRDEDR